MEDISTSEQSAKKEVSTKISPETRKFLTEFQSEQSLKTVAQGEGLRLAGSRRFFANYNMDGIRTGDGKYLGSGIYLSEDGDIVVKYDSDTLYTHEGKYFYPSYQGRLNLNIPDGNVCIESIQGEFEGEIQNNLEPWLSNFLKPSDMEIAIPWSIRLGVRERFSDAVKDAGENATNEAVREKISGLTTELLSNSSGEGRWTKVLLGEINDARDDYFEIYE